MTKIYTYTVFMGTFCKKNYKCDIRCQNDAKSPRPPFHSVCLSVKNSKISKYPLLEITEGVTTTVYHWIHSIFFIYSDIIIII